MSKDITATGYNRFEYYLALCTELVNKAAEQKDPGLWLFENNFRTPLFMLEALAKLYSTIHNQKKFTKLKERFKFLEDELGSIDYYNAFAKEFSDNKNISATIIEYLQEQKQKSVTALNSILYDKNWLNGNKRIEKIRETLQEADWLSEEKDTRQLHKFYEKEIERINKFVKEKEFHFVNIEEDVHELRRKLRWLSIYPQALRGTVQLSKSKSVPQPVEKYLTPEIVNSAFNKMPDAAGNQHFLLLEENEFYALSWMIATLGTIKDDGLSVIALSEALAATEKITATAATKKAYLLLGKNQPTIAQLLKKAMEIAKTYFKEKNLNKLVIGLGAIKN